MAKRESNFWNATRKKLESLRQAGYPLWFWKTAGTGRTKKGLPDVDIVFHGFAIKIELKADDGEPTALQERRIMEIRAAGGRAFVAQEWDEIRAALNEAVRDARALAINAGHRFRSNEVERIREVE